MDEVEGPGYLTPTEALQIHDKFSSTLEGEQCLVFWTGRTYLQATEWANSNNLKTLAMAMGSLYSGTGPKDLRSQKSPKEWSMYMKGVSQIYALHARRKRQAIVITNPPPDIYSKRPQSSYRDIEEPILKEIRQGSCTLRIDYVHPMVSGAESFQYQVWPDNHSSEWFAFLSTITTQSLINTIDERTENTDKKQICAVSVTQAQRTALSIQKNNNDQNDTQPSEEVSKSTFVRKLFGLSPLKSLVGTGQVDKHVQMQKATNAEKVPVQRQQAQDSIKAVIKEMAALKQRQAQETTSANKQKAALEQRHAQETKAAKKQRVALEQRHAQERKAAKKQRVALEQRHAQERKAAKKQRVALEQRQAQETTSANKQRAALEQRHAQETMSANKQRAALEQRHAQEKKAAKKQRVALEQRHTHERKAVEEQKVAHTERLTQQINAAIKQQKAQKTQAAKQQNVAHERKQAQEKKAAKKQKAALKQQKEKEQRAAKLDKAELSQHLSQQKKKKK